MTPEQILIPAEDAGKRLDAVLAEQMEDLTRSAAARLCEEGRVRLGEKPLAKNYRLSGGETVTVELPEPEPIDAVPQDIPLDIVYEDEDVIVINKPKGLVVHPAPGHPDGTLVNALLYHCGESLSGIGGATGSTGTPPASSSRPKTISHTKSSPPNCRTTPSPGCTGASWWGRCPRRRAPWTHPSAATPRTARRWRSSPAAAAP